MATLAILAMAPVLVMPSGAAASDRAKRVG